MSEINRRNFIKQTTGLVATLLVPKTLQATTEKTLTSRDELYHIPEKELLARMIFGETRNCSTTEQMIIGYTAFNRANDKKTFNGEGSLSSSLLRIYLEDHQYDCFDDKNPKIKENFQKTLNPQKYNPKKWDHCKTISYMLLNNRLSFLNQGQTVYVANYQVEKWGKNKNTPRWFKNIEKIDYFNMQDLKHKICKDT